VATSSGWSPVVLATLGAAGVVAAGVAKLAPPKVLLDPPPPQADKTSAAQRLKLGVNERKGNEPKSNERKNVGVK
jgi:hypothetical protein